MTKLWFFAAMCVLVGFKTQAQDEGIVFRDISWDEALQAAADESKPIFLEGYVHWSQPCAVLEKYVFTDQEVGAFFNENFVNIRLDMDDFPGAQLGELHGVDSYPTLLFLDAEGELIHRGCGAVETNELIALGRQALGDSTLRWYQEQFAAGERSNTFLVNFSLLLADACMESTFLVDTFFAETPKEQWVDEVAWNMINLNISDVHSEQFQYLLTQQQAFADRYGKDTVEAKIYTVLLDQLIAIYEGEDLTLFATQSLEKLMQEVDFARQDELLSLTQLKTADLKANWKKYGASAVKVVDEQDVTDPDQLNEFGWKFYLFVEDQAHLAKAAEWMKQVITTYPNATYLDTYASLQYKLGNSKAAVKYGKQALQAAELELEDLMHYREQLAMFEAELD
ncbi:thioredoxin family protein [Marinoscillum furvescens]|uniref:Thioredoxin-like protein n=1 Tax=Marinoscillum furvescens DSM 4134 TaxID=1122208 RepID=A0A3D9L0W8_MARFU|nr:thioredoxin family protein [Marinoscillum furvescens]RED96673.1 thioredoxin-like protein [Marinoscillum furvescens DSM 4134]